MKTAPIFLLLATSSLHAELYVTNFMAINGTAEATGVWRNEDTSTDLPQFPVKLSQSGGLIQAANGGSTSSIIDSTGGQIYNLWEDVKAFPPLTPGIDVFEPNFVGDYINIETNQGATTTVTLDFGASITDPIISFTDVEYRSTITFPSAITKLAGTSNLKVTGSSLTSDKSTAAGDPGVFEQEAAGSVQLTGTFEKVVFEVAVAIGDGTVGVNDRTGYVVSTRSAPQPITGGNNGSRKLNITRDGDQVTLTWEIGAFDSIEISSDGVSGWTPILDLDPGSVGTWTGSIEELGDYRFFKGVYTP